MLGGIVEVGPLQPSGRVIAGGRLLLACLFLVAVWVDGSQPAQQHGAFYLLLAAYVGWSLSVTLIVWNNWWLEARLAAPAHVIDVAVFMFMLYSTDGSTSPYFTFFIFILLAAAIRWGWKETAVTAAAIIAIYFSAGLMLGPDPQVETERFIVRTGHLLIISAILIWFGANQWVPWRRTGPYGRLFGAVHDDPFIAALQSAMAAVGARRAIMHWRDTADQEIFVVRISAEGARRSLAAGDTDLPTLTDSLLFDLPKDRVLMRAEAGRWRFFRTSGALPAGFREAAGATRGLAIPIATGTTEGLAVFEDVRALATDHLDVAPRVAHALALRIQEAAVLAAVEEHSTAKARVAVARDLHDSVVQFLAGLGFRLEALRRSPAAAGALVDGLGELKDMVMAEQRQMRAFIRGLRTGKPVSLHDLSRDCESLCQLLSRQWSIDCACACRSGAGWVPLRTQLDIEHLVREAVANAVRHGQATRVRVSMVREEAYLRLTVADNGLGFAALADGADIGAPASLHGRVREVRGQLAVHSSNGDTSVVIRLPLDEAA